MRGTRSTAAITAATILTAVLGLTAVGTGAAGAAAQPTGATKAYCSEVEQMADEFGGDPGIDAIFDTNPDPTLAEWAAFLPGPIAKMRKFADDLAATDPPAALAADVRTVVKRWRAVVAFFEAEQRAAAAGDRKAFEAGDARRDPLVNKLGKAMQVVAKRCGLPTGSGG